MKPWEETWVLYDHETHVNDKNEWMHLIKRADCPHEAEEHKKCDVVVFERIMADGRCDDEFDAVLARARLATMAPELYRALARCAKTLDGDSGLLVEALDVLRKARGEET